jgi:hypothetical protein
MKKFLLAALFLLGLASPALAQTNACSGGGVAGMIVGGPAGACAYLKVNPDGSLSVGGSGGAALTSTNLAGAISVTNTFQSIQALTAARAGCTIQNQSTTNPMWVFFGPIGSATKAKSFILDPGHGLSISCTVAGNGSLTDQVSIAGTAADLFNANFQ